MKSCFTVSQVPGLRGVRGPDGLRDRRRVEGVGLSDVHLGLTCGGHELLRLFGEGSKLSKLHAVVPGTEVFYEQNTNNVSDMFPPRNWTIQDLDAYCTKHYGVKPEPVLNRLQLHGQEPLRNHFWPASKGCET